MSPSTILFAEGPPDGEANAVRLAMLDTGSVRPGLKVKPTASAVLKTARIGIQCFTVTFDSIGRRTVVGVTTGESLGHKPSKKPVIYPARWCGGRLQRISNKVGRKTLASHLRIRNIRKEVRDSIHNPTPNVAEGAHWARSPLVVRGICVDRVPSAVS